MSLLTLVVALMGLWIPVQAAQPDPLPLGSVGCTTAEIVSAMVQRLNQIDTAAVDGRDFNREADVMARVMIQIGNGKYARATASDGEIEIAVGDVAGANFFSITSKRYPAMPVWDGSGWDLRELDALARRLAPIAHACEAPELTALKKDLLAQYRRRVAVAAEAGAAPEVVQELAVMQTTLRAFGQQVPKPPKARERRGRRRRQMMRLPA